MKYSVPRCGFTLVEVLVVVSIVGLLAAIAVPAVDKAMEYRANTRTASRFRQAMAAFELYHSENGSWPPDRTPGVTPPEMVDYFAEMGIDEWWGSQTDIGGRWDWDKGYHFALSVSISSPTKKTDHLEDLDRLMDDGDLATGRLRKLGVQFHYIIEE